MSASSSSSDRDPLERLAAEFLDRRRRGEDPSPTEYAEKYPQWAEQILEFFPALEVMEGLKPGSGDGTASHDGGAQTTAPPPLEQLGEYRILREIGHGGMGVVYEAIQETLGRRVALKVLPMHGRIDAIQMQRFQLEARSAARLHHSSIVPVYGVGEAGGIHYYVMQYIQGHGLDVILDDLRRLRNGVGVAGGAKDDTGSVAVARSLLTGQFAASKPERDGGAPSATVPEDEGGSSPAPDDRSATAASISSVLSNPTESGYYRAVARLGIHVAQALAHAHAQGVLHRDIKPSNLLLDVDGHVWITDFGLAKVEGAEGPTRTDDIIGTLRFMGPERFEGWSDRRSDIYGLGVTLYEMLTLRPAFDAGTRLRLIEQVIHDPPPAPRKVDPRIPRDLETIVLKAIAKEPGERYATAEALASDLENYMADRPIVARRSGPTERAWRWCRRNPVAAALLVVSGLGMLTLVGLGVALGYQSRLQLAYTEADRNRRVAEQQSSIALGALVREKESAVFSQMVLAEREWHAGNAARVEPILNGIPPQYRGWEWHYLKRVCHSEFQEISGLFTNQVFGVAFSPDPEGRRIATASVHDGVMVWDTSTHRLLLRLSGLDGLVVSVAFSRDGERLAAGVCKFEQPGAIWIGSPVTGLKNRTFSAHVGIIYCVAFNPDGTRLASAGEDGTVSIWDTETGALIHPLKDETQEFTSVAFSPDGKYLAAATGTRKEQFPENRPGKVRIWDTSTWREIPTLKKHTGSVNGIAFSPNGHRLASASSDRTVKIWDVESGDEVNTLRGHAGFVVGVAFHPDGKLLVSASEDSTLRIWDTETGEDLVILHGHAGPVNGVAYSPDGKRIASVADDKTVKIWDADQPPITVILGGPGRKWFTDVAFSTNGEFLVAANGDRTVTIWDRASYQVQRVLPEHNDPIWGVAYSRDGLIASACGDVFRSGQSCEVRIWNGKTGQLVKPLPMRVNAVWSVAFSPDGHLMATGGGDFQKEPVELEVWDTRRWVVLHTLPGHRLGVACVAFSPDGQSLASGASDGLVKVWDVRTGRCTRTLTLEGGETGALGVAFSPDGQSLATAGTQSLTIWSLATGKRLKVLLGHIGEVRQVAFHPEGQRLASGGRDGTVRIWDLRTGQEVLALRGHDGPVEGVAFSPDGLQLASAGRDGTVRIWDATPWVEPAPQSSQASRVNGTR